MKNKRKQNHKFYRDLQQAAACDIKKNVFFDFFMGSNEFFSDPFEKLNLEAWASTLQSIGSQTRRHARTRPCTSYCKLACFLLYLKIINTLKNKICILCYSKLSKKLQILVCQAVFKLWIKTLKMLFGSITQEPLGLLKFWCYIWVSWTILLVVYITFQKGVDNFEMEHKTC